MRALGGVSVEESRMDEGGWQAAKSPSINEQIHDLQRGRIDFTGLNDPSIFQGCKNLRKKCYPDRFHPKGICLECAQAVSSSADLFQSTRRIFDVSHENHRRIRFVCLKRK